MPGELQTRRQRLRAVSPKGNELSDSPLPGESALVSGINLIESEMNILSEQSERLNPNEIYKLANSLSGLVRALCELNRYRMERDGSIKIAHEILVGEVKEQLKGKPEIVQGLISEISTAQAKLEQ